MNFFTNVIYAMQEYPWFFYTCMTIVGLMVGSFLNVVIYRLPIMMERNFKEEYEEYFHPETEHPKREKFNLMVPASHCPKCNHKISAWENIPLLSYIILRGKCHKCGLPISMRYPLVEGFTALMTFIAAFHFGPSVAALGAILLTWCLIAISGIDFDKMLIPDEIVLPLIWIGLLFNIAGTYTDLASAVIGAIAGYMILWCFYWGFKLCTGKEGMGYGDFKLTACFGAWLGYKMLGIVIIGSALVGAFIGITAMLVKNKGKSKPIPFGPYIALAGFIGMLYGEKINDWYIQFVMFLRT